MRSNKHPTVPLAAALGLAAAMLVACGGGSNGSGVGGTTGGTTGGTVGGTLGGTTTGGTTGGGDLDGRTFIIRPGENATREMIGAMIQAAPGDVIQFTCGYFELNKALQLINTEDVTVKGCGKDLTVLSFHNSDTPEGILAVNVHGLWIEDLTVLDTGGNGIELRGVDNAALRRVRTIWSSGGGRESPDRITADNVFQNNSARLKVACTDPATLNPEAPENSYPGADTSSPDYTVSKKSGRYGIYPVSSENILIEQAESIGASDAGIYVGQTNNAIIRDSRAAYNVFGFEIENVQGGEYANNLAECNTGGFLIYDLDNLRQYGDRSRMYGNVSRNNNTYNFTAGGIVGSVPSGSGMITLSYDRIDIFENRFENNNTGGIIHASYELFPEGAGRPEERRIDWYTEGMHIWGNRFVNNGNGLPRPTTNDLSNGEVARVLPALVGLKTQAACLIPTNLPTCLAAGGTGFRGGHIVWDGLLDELDADCAFPKDRDGEDVPRDERGKPIHTNDHPNPPCHYNAYKFNEAGQRIVPDWWASCIDANNDFSNDSLKFVNFKGTKGLEGVLAVALANPGDGPDALTGVLSGLAASDLANFAASFDMSAHDCPTAYQKNLAPLPPVVIPPFERSGDYDPAPSDALIAELCGADLAPGAVNFEAAAKVNCPTLAQYNLFSDAQDPTSTPNAGGLPFSMNTKLFSDYAVKYRVAWVPPGSKALFHSGRGDNVNSTVQFPPGTIIAKTFSFLDEEAGTETAVETRLLIKRVNSKGTERWDGLVYIWETEGGERVAKLAMGGGETPASWHFRDVDSDALNVGSTPAYQIPHANQCLSCHANQDVDNGSAPIGPKLRNLNGPFRSESSMQTDQAEHPVAGQNQIKFWCDSGFMDCRGETVTVDPNTQIATNIERVPVFNKPGDSGHAADSAADIEARTRGYLEVNCQHCHNERGFAASTGLYLDVRRIVDSGYGICKRPTATGQEGNGGRTVDLHPGNVGDSILPYRIGPTATTPAARMPPLARSVHHAEGHALVERWIAEVLVKDNSKYPDSESCGE